MVVSFICGGNQSTQRKPPTSIIEKVAKTEITDDSITSKNLW
jgi:hypothetical protein